MALRPRLVGETRLGPANALLHAVQDLGVLIGPAIGALLLALGPPWVAFLANGATLAAPALRPALDLSSTAPGVKVPAGETRLVDDPRSVEA